MSVVHELIWLYVWVIIIAALLSWFPAHSGGALAGVQRVLARLTEPVLRPLRAIIPRPSVGGMGIDLSPLVAVLLLTIINNVI
jgi:YggT family protein